MEKIKIICCSATLALIFTKSHAQKLDENLFNSLCNEIAKQDRYQKIIDNLKDDAVLVEDPITGEQDIFYKSNGDYVVDFKKRSRAEQFKILEAIALPNLPLNDTVYVNDSLNIFSYNVLSKIDGKVFIHNGTSEYKPAYSLIGIKSLIIRNSTFILSCWFPNSTFVSTYSFIYQNEKFSISKLSSYNTDDPHFRRQIK